MHQTTEQITLFIVSAILLITILMSFFITMIFLYRKRQQQFEKNLFQTKINYEKLILTTQVEIQEQTFQHISKEIHDNINLSLTLTKLNLHTLDWAEQEKAEQKIKSSIDLLSSSIAQLNDLSKSLDTDTITRAKTADLLLNYHPDYLEVIITDEGKGFDPSQQPKIGHAGLRNMENRVKLLGGTMNIDSQSGSGTQLNFIIPFEKL